jgi:hypothetical protein
MSELKQKLIDRYVRYKDYSLNGGYLRPSENGLAICDILEYLTAIPAQVAEPVKETPKWTVVYNIVSPESDQWVGTGWEFFGSEQEAELCRARHERLGNVPTKRRWHSVVDMPHLGAAHRYHLTAAEPPAQAPLTFGPYKGYRGKAKYDPEASTWHGRCIGIKDVVTFVGADQEIEKAFYDSVDDYIEMCDSRGEITDVPVAPEQAVEAISESEMKAQRHISNCHEEINRLNSELAELKQAMENGGMTRARLCELKQHRFSVGGVEVTGEMIVEIERAWSENASLKQQVAELTGKVEDTQLSLTNMTQRYDERGRIIELAQIWDDRRENGTIDELREAVSSLHHGLYGYAKREMIRNANANARLKAELGNGEAVQP